MSNKWITVAVSAVTFVAVWNLLDYIAGTFVTGEGYQFKIIGDLVLPIIVSIIVDVFLFRSRKSE